MDLRRIESSLETVSLEYFAYEKLKKFITRALRIRIEILDSDSCVYDVVSTLSPRGKRKDKTRKSKYGSRRSLKFK